jgi:hypothetical protein
MLSDNTVMGAGLTVACMRLSYHVIKTMPLFPNTVCTVHATAPHPAHLSSSQDFQLYAVHVSEGHRACGIFKFFFPAVREL